MFGAKLHVSDWNVNALVVFCSICKRFRSGKASAQVKSREKRKRKRKSWKKKAFRQQLGKKVPTIDFKMEAVAKSATAKVGCQLGATRALYVFGETLLISGGDKAQDPQ